MAFSYPSIVSTHRQEFSHMFCGAAESALKGLEVSPQAMSIAGDLAQRIAAQGGAALLIDYGRNRSYPASLQAIKQHQFCGLLEQPGLADLSAHVDFSSIRCDPNLLQESSARFSSTRCATCCHHKGFPV